LSSCFGWLCWWRGHAITLAQSALAIERQRCGNLFGAVGVAEGSTAGLHRLNLDAEDLPVEPACHTADDWVVVSAAAHFHRLRGRLISASMRKRYARKLGEDTSHLGATCSVDDCGPQLTLRKRPFGGSRRLLRRFGAEHAQGGGDLRSGDSEQGPGVVLQADRGKVPRGGVTSLFIDWIGPEGGVGAGFHGAAAGARGVGVR
jgi:hypothetical protein